MKTWVSVLTAAVVLIGVACINLYVPFIKFDGDNAGTFISALGVLVTALVGWQIFNAIEMRSIIKEYDDLKNKFNAANDALSVQDRRNIELIEAFDCKRLAEVHIDNKSISHLTISYEAFLAAIKHFLNANMKSDYKPLNASVKKLGNILSDIESLQQKDLVEFNHRREELEAIYDDIIIAINNKLDEYQKIKRLIKQCHDRRIRIHNMSSDSAQS